MPLKKTFHEGGTPVIGLLLDNLFEDYEENIWAGIVAVIIAGLFLQIFQQFQAVMILNIIIALIPS